jgi:hypothetical protein
MPYKQGSRQYDLSTFTGACGTESPAFYNFLLKYLFSIKFLNHFTPFSFIYRVRVHIHNNKELLLKINIETES